MKVSMTLHPKPWYMRFWVALELTVWGSAAFEGEIRDLEEVAAK